MTWHRLRTDDSGFMLPLVLLITMLVLIGTATSISVVSNNLTQSRHSQDAEAALAAAEAGIQNYVATLNQHCVTSSISQCEWLSIQSSSGLTGTAGSEKFCAAAQNPSGYIDNGNDLRITSVGLVGAGWASEATCTAATGTTTRTLIADVSGIPSALRYAYFSDYETLSGEYLNGYYPARSINLSGSAVKDALGLSSSTNVTWNGLNFTSSNDICDALYYDDPSNPTPGGLGRYNTSAGADDSADQDLFTETGVLGSDAVSRDATCEVTFSDGMTFNGPVYSQDALFLSNGTPGGLNGPEFNVPAAESLPAASSAWSSGDSPVASGSPYRSFPIIGGTPDPANAVQTSPAALTLPASNSDAAGSATCVYQGPTRIALSGNTATVTSPLTSGGCGSSVNVTSTSIYVANSASSSAPSWVGGSGDITTYSSSSGDAYVSGSLTSGKLSVVAQHDIVVTGNLTVTDTTTTNAFGENGWASGAAIDLVAQNNVRVYHPVSCASGSATSASGYYCRNDITGLYTTSEASAVVKDDGTLRSAHPARQYCNGQGDTTCGSSADSSCDSGDNADRSIDAAVFALNGSLLTDNYNRGCAMGDLTVTGGVYEDHRGATGQQWEIANLSSGSNRSYSGYKLQIDYVSYAEAGLPYVPALRTGSPNRPWIVIAEAAPDGAGS